MSIKYKNSDIITVPNVAALFNLKIQDNQLVQTLGYTTEGKGGNLYRYDAGSSATPDYGFTLDGLGGNGAGIGSGRFIAVDTSVANVMQFGAQGDGSTDDTTALQQVFSTTSNIYIPAGVYLVSATLQMASGVHWRSIQGQGRNSRIKCSISDGTPCIDLNGTISTTISDLSIWGVSQSSPYQNCIGMEWGGAQHWTVRNVEIRYCSTLYKIDGGFIGTGTSMLGKYGGLGLTASALNNVDMSLHLENCNQPLVITSGTGTRIDYMHESPTGPTSSSTIDGCHGLVFSSCYSEYSSSVTVPEFVIGGTTACSAVEFNGLTAAWTVSGQNIPYIDADDVDGLRVTGRINANAGVQTVRASTSTKNLQVYVIDNAKTQKLASVTSISSNGPIVNLYDDPFFDLGLPILTSTPATSESLDTTTTLPWAKASMKLTIDGAGSFAYASRSVGIHGLLTRSLGKTVGIGAWFKAPNNSNYVAGDGRCEIRLTSDGTGGTTSATQNQQWVPGEWTFCFNYLAIPSDATTLTIEWWANRSSTVLLGEEVYVGGTVIWVGGLDNKLRVENGIFTIQNPLQPIYGNGSPEGAISARVGQLFIRTDGGASTTLYIKESGTGNTGWAAK